MRAISRDQTGNVTLSLHVQPGAKQTTLAGWHGNAVKIRLAAPPVDGKANVALVAYLAEQLSTAKKNVTILSGECARQKIVRVESVSEEAWRQSAFFALLGVER